MDGMNADFAGAKICPAADTCQSSNRTLHKMGKLLKTKSLLVLFVAMRRHWLIFPSFNISLPFRPIANFVRYSFGLLPS